MSGLQFDNRFSIGNLATLAMLGIAAGGFFLNYEHRMTIVEEQQASIARALETVTDVAREDRSEMKDRIKELERWRLTMMGYDRNGPR